MKEYPTESIRNIALISHSSAGKTILAEVLLNFTGATTRIGSIADGTTVSDHDEEEIRRQISLYTSVLPVEHKGVKINLLDTPGYMDFVGEVISGLSVSDGAIILVDAVSGREVGTEVAWNYCDQFNLPRFLLINKMDRDNANFQKALDSVQEFSEARLVPVQLPMGEKEDFKGVIDLLSMKAYPGDGKKAEEIPAEFQDAAQAARTALVEAAAESDDALMEKYFETESLTDDEVRQGLRNVMASGDFVPVFASSATSQIGLDPLLDAIVALMPSPADRPKVMAKGMDGDEEITTSAAGDLLAYVWKTTADPFVGKQTYFRIYSGVINSDSKVWNHTQEIEERFGTVTLVRGKETIPTKAVHAGDLAAVPKLSETSTGNSLCDKGHPLEMPATEYPGALYQVAIFPKTQADAAKISTTLNRLCEEDMTLSWKTVAATNQTILQGMGGQHIDVAIRRAQAKFQVNLLIKEPKVPYQETIQGNGTGVYRHKKQTGGSGQFAEVHMKVSATEEQYEFSNDIFGGSISSSYMSAIDKGVKSVMKDGVIAGFPVHGVHVSVFDGKEHPVDSKPVAFEIAGREAFKIAFTEAKAILLEPIMNVRIICPESNMGDILGDLNTRRARIQGMDTEKGRSVVTAQVPLVEMLRYTTHIRSMTGGRGMFSMEDSHYEVVPSHLTQEIIDAKVKEDEEKEE
jgi:elongation factor G